MTAKPGYRETLSRAVGGNNCEICSWSFKIRTEPWKNLCIESQKSPYLVRDRAGDLSDPRGVPDCIACICRQVSRRGLPQPLSHLQCNRETTNPGLACKGNRQRRCERQQPAMTGLSLCSPKGDSQRARLVNWTIEGYKLLEIRTMSRWSLAKRKPAAA